MFLLIARTWITACFAPICHLLPDALSGPNTEDCHREIVVAITPQLPECLNHSLQQCHNFSHPECASVSKLLSVVVNKFRNIKFANKKTSLNKTQNPVVENLLSQFSFFESLEVNRENPLLKSSSRQ